MSFRLAPNPTYSWPFVLIIPNEGKKEKHAFDLIFNRLTQERIDELTELARVTENIVRGRTVVGDDQEEPERFLAREVAKEVVAGWSNVLDENDKPLSFTDSTFDRLLKIPTAADQIVRAFFKSIDVSKRGN
jgi:hypothetical protein